MLIGPAAGVVLDRLNRKQVMIASDLIRAVVALGFILTIGRGDTWLLYLVERAADGGLAVLHRRPRRHSALHRHPRGAAHRQFAHPNHAVDHARHRHLPGRHQRDARSATSWAFAGNALSFLISALCISRLFLPGRGFRPPRRALTEAEVVRPWHEYVEGLRYMRGVPLVMGLLLINIGWATGGGAAQILFTVFGEIVFNRGPAGLGMIWGFAGVGLLAGGALGLHAWAAASASTNYKRAIVVCYIVHGGSYILFSQMRSFGWALVFIALSRAGVGVSSVLNMSQLLRIVPDEFRGRVFATMESVHWSVMMLSMTLARHRIANTGTRAPSAPWRARSAPRPRYSGAGPT